MVETYQPIVLKEDVGPRSLLQRRLVPDGNAAIVLYRDSQAPLVIRSMDKVPSRTDLLFGHYRCLYKVNTGQYVWSFPCELRSKTAGFSFQAEVTLSCSVDDPVVVIQQHAGQTDICQFLQRRTFEVLESVSCDYDIHEDNSAAAAVRQRLEQATLEAGFAIKLVSLKLSSEAPITDMIRERTLIQLSSRKQVTLMAETANLERTSLEQTIEMEHVRSRLDTARQQRLERKVGLYSRLLETGSLGLLALQLSQNPEDMATVSRLLGEQPQAALQKKLGILKAATEDSGVEGKPLDESEKQVIQRLIGLAEAPRPALGSAQDQAIAPKPDSEPSEQQMRSLNGQASGGQTPENGQTP
ncbi:MAG: hypothetical protein ACFB5Z_18165 [Elainellaceae cyanobacterium]